MTLTLTEKAERLIYKNALYIKYEQPVNRTKYFDLYALFEEPIVLARANRQKVLKDNNFAFALLHEMGHLLDQEYFTNKQMEKIQRIWTIKEICCCCLTKNQINKIIDHEWVAWHLAFKYLKLITKNKKIYKEFYKFRRKCFGTYLGLKKLYEKQK